MHQPPSSHPDSELLRAIGRWSMVALAVNSILGSGIFGLPSVVAGLLGKLSPLAVLLAGCGMAVIIACYAEVASQFTQTGGTYLYLRQAFGRFIGIEVAWLMLLGRLTACAAAVNLLVVYLAEFWPHSTEPVPRLIVMSVLVGTLAAVNYRGVGAGTLVSNVSVVGKLAALALVALAGVAYLSWHPQVTLPPAHPGMREWLSGMLLLLFAYGGYEAALNPMGEARDPRRDAGFALFVALVTLTILYTLLQYVVIAVLPDAAHSERPLADVARAVLGPAGAALIAIGALLSVYGYLSANLLTGPRGLFALAERGDFLELFARVHPRFRTPYVSVFVFAFLVWAFALFANFKWNVTLSAVARISYYLGVCLAVPVLRRRQPGAALLRLPGGLFLPALGVLLCATLFLGVDFSQWLILIVTVLLAALNWLIVRRRGARPAVSDSAAQRSAGTAS
jgi:amino acid transporter